MRKLPQPKTPRQHLELDAAGQSVGRLASQIAKILTGKHRAQYTPHIDDGDFVTVLNASKVKFTGRKFVQKDYKRHTMHPGGLKVVSMARVFEENPGKVIEHAVLGMLPKNQHRPEVMKRLTIKA